MSRMLFLRDIQVDIQMRCRTCGHEGVLARPDLERRFGPNYPVLSIAPHYRCSRCDSKDVESRPALETRTPMPAAEERHGFDDALGALQGLLQSIRSPEPRHDEDADVQNLMDDDRLDTLAEGYSEAVGGKEPDERRRAAMDAFDSARAGLPLATVYDEPVDDEPEAEPEETPAEDRPRDRDAEPTQALTDLPDEMLAALHALLGESEAAGTVPAKADDERPEDAASKEDADEEETDGIPEDPDDVSPDEILSFAVRDPDFGSEPAGDDFEDDLDLDDEPEESVLDLEPEPAPEPESLRRRPPPGSLDESLAALRALVEKAAAEEPGPEPRDDDAPPSDEDEDEEADEPALPEPADLEPSANGEPEGEEEGEPVTPYKTAQEKSLEDTLAQLRGMLDLDNASGQEDEPVIKPRRR